MSDNRYLDPTGFHCLHRTLQAAVIVWLERHGVAHTDCTFIEEIEPGQFRITGLDRDADGRVAVVNDAPVHWQRDVIDEWAPPFWSEITRG